MGYLVIRRFRNGDGPAASRVFQRDADAREAAQHWAEEGWAVELVARGQRDVRTMKLPRPPDMPPHRDDL